MMMRRLFCILFLAVSFAIAHVVLSNGNPEGSLSASSSDQIQPGLKSWSITSKVQGNAQAMIWADSVLSTMSLKDQVCQLFVYTIAPDRTKANEKLLSQVVSDYKVGGLLFSGGEVENQAILTNEAQDQANVPLMICFDGEWGLAMRLKQTPTYPRNRVLGSITQDTLLRAYGKEVARQMRLLGVTVNFAPVADVDNNPKNPVINTRSFGEQPWNVADKVKAYSQGLETGGVLAVAKHFPGHGDTDTDSHKSLPVLKFDRARLDSVELRPFREAFQSGVSGVMVGHLDVPALTSNSGKATSISKEVVTGLLQEEMGFKGLVFTDALVMGGVGGNTSVCLQALKAGNDMLLVPPRIKEELAQILSAVKSGEISEEYIKEKCRKVLMYKYVLGLSRKPVIQVSGLSQRIKTPESLELSDRLLKEATVVLKCQDASMPVASQQERLALLVPEGQASLPSLVKGLSSGVKVETVTLAKNPASWKTLKSKLEEFDRILIPLSSSNLWDPGSFIVESKLDKPVSCVLFTALRDAAKYPKLLSSCKTVILAHSLTDAQMTHVADLVLGRSKASGRLSVSLTDEFKAGAGTDYPHSISQDFSQELQPVMLFESLSLLDAIAQEGIDKKAYPGCQIVVLKDGQIVYEKAFGTHTYESGQKVRLEDLYDLASLTKTTATLLAIMKLYDKGKISVTDKASSYLDYLKGTNKSNITIKDLLFHESGLPASINFYLEAVDQESYEGHLISSRRDALHKVQVGANSWANPNFSYLDGLTSPVKTEKHTWQVSQNLWIDPVFRQKYHEKIVAAPLRAKRYLYSDLNFILLQEIVEKITGGTLDAFVSENIYEPMGLERTLYKPLDRIPAEEIVPTVQENLLRKQLLRGYVHDEAAAFQGGVSGNAGLFSNAFEVSKIYQMLLDGGTWQGKNILSASTVHYFTTTKSRISRRGLGFDKPQTDNPDKSPCCANAPAAVFGHTGFTGTCAWVDPVNHLVLVFLSNRVYPDPWVNRLSTLDIRARLQSAMYEALVKTN